MSQLSAPQTRILVDADACPVKDLIERAAVRHGVSVWMVTATAMKNRGLARPARNSPHLRNRPERPAVPVPDFSSVEVIRIDSGPDAVDDWIIEHCRPGDIVVTQDIPLAAAVIGRGARVIENRGEVLGPSNIGVRLAMRDLTMGLRESGAIDPNKGPRPISRRDHQRFAEALGRLLDEARK